MTKKQLLNNLNNTKRAQLFGETYKVIAETKSEKAKNIFVMVSDERKQPIYILRYRLDLNFLTDIVSLYCMRPTADSLKEYEDAIKTGDAE